MQEGKENDAIDRSGHHDHQQNDDFSSSRCSTDDMERIEVQLKTLPVWNRNRQFCIDALNVCRTWHGTFADDNIEIWRHIRKRFAKEVNEVEPCIHYALQLIGRYKGKKNNDGSTATSKRPRWTIIDVCSGFGICSMLLSYLLPPNEVEKILLVDKMFPLKGYDAKHMFMKHLLPPANEMYPIPLYYRKVDMKATRQRNQLDTYIVKRSEGPVLLLGVHLCKALSVHCIKLYESNVDQIAAMILKPCCLPGKQMVCRKAPILWTFNNGFCFGPNDLYDMKDKRMFQNSKPKKVRRKEKTPRLNDDGESIIGNDSNGNSSERLGVEKEVENEDGSFNHHANVEEMHDEQESEHGHFDEEMEACSQGKDHKRHVISDGYHAKPERNADGPVNLYGAQKNHNNERFTKWVDFLSKACQPSPGHLAKNSVTDEAISSKIEKNKLDNTIANDRKDRVWVENINVTHHHFQNSYIYCERPWLIDDAL